MVQELEGAPDQVIDRVACSWIDCSRPERQGQQDVLSVRYGNGSAEPLAAPSYDRMTSAGKPRGQALVWPAFRLFEAVAAARGGSSLLAGLGIVIVGSLLLEISRLNTWDEAWFLHVVTRLLQGDVLYREVFYPATPLAAYAGAGIVGLFGSEMVVLKLAGVACIAGTFLLSIRIAEQMRTPLSPIVFGAAVFLVELPYTFGYTILATMLLVATLGALLSWHARVTASTQSPLRWLVLTGALAGACLAAKHNVGALVGAATLISVLTLLHEHRRPSARETMTSLAALIVPMAILPLTVMVPVLLSGGLPAAVDYTITSQSEYLQYNDLSYEAGFTLSMGAMLPDAPVSVETLLAGLQVGRPWVYLLPPAVALAAAWAWWRRPRVFRGPGVPLILFTAVAAASIFPLAEQSHFTVTAPVFLVAIAYLLRGELPRAASLLGLGCVALAGLMMVTAPLLWMRIGSEVSSTAHLRGVVITPGYESQLLDRVREIRLATREGPTFYLFPEAALYYLLAGSANPTPYDFPLRTGFGTEGVHLVTEKVESGEIALVCLDRTWGMPGPLPGPFPDLQPVELATWVRVEMTHVTTVAACDVYARRVVSPPN